jgi:hypothetical protein
MPHTAGIFSQDGFNADGQIFVDPTKFVAGTGTSPLSVDGSGIPVATLVAATAAVLYANLGLLLRTGVYATPAGTQRQFGTAANQPGPSTVANTSGPLAQQGLPPIPAAHLPTIIGGKAGPVAKGFQINWIDLITNNQNVANTLYSSGLFTYPFADKTAAAKTTLLAYAANGLDKTAYAGIRVQRITPTTIAPIITTDTEPVLQVGITPGAVTGTLFYGAVVGVSFNFN